jgi:hypothetical protein
MALIFQEHSALMENQRKIINQMKKTFLFLVLLCLVLQVIVPQTSFGQLFMTQTGKTSFFSKTPVEDISALNSNVLAVINSSNGEIAVKMNMTQFKFQNKLMEEHFNENYMESDKFPTGSFKGKINESIDYAKAGTYDVTAKGTFTIHGVTKDKVLTGKLTVAKEALTLDSNFEIALVDYKIDVPKLVWEKIAEKIAVKNNFTLVKK